MRNHLSAAAALFPVDLRSLYALWDQLGDIPTVIEREAVDTIGQPFRHFPAGTHREEIWRWFEAQNPQFIVGDVMQGIRIPPKA